MDSCLTAGAHRTWQVVVVLLLLLPEGLLQVVLLCIRVLQVPLHPQGPCLSLAGQRVRIAGPQLLLLHCRLG